MNRGTPGPAPRARGGRPALAACIGLALAMAAARPASADLILTAQDATAAAGSTGNSFDLVLKNTGPGSVTVGGFFFELTVADAAITFTGVTIATSPAPYIFDGLGLIGPNIGTVVNGQDIMASDLFSVIGSGTTLGSGASVGLGHVSFNASATAAGSYTVRIAPSPATSLTDTSFPTPNDIPITTLSNGTIRIRTASVPVPASIGLVGPGLALATLLGGRRRR